MRTFPTRPIWAGPLALCVLTGAACDITPRGRDAADPSGQRIAEVAVRLDAPNGGTPSVSVVAFRATVTGVSPEEVLPAVDPLVAQPPEGACALRDVAGGARALGAQGGRVELEALHNLTLELGTTSVDGETLELVGGSVLRPSPRVYPNLASVVGGVIAEAGPIDLLDSPNLLSLGDGGARVAVPALPRIENADGSLLPAKPSFSASRDLVLSVTGPARTFVELRPFVATWALACPVTPHPGGAANEYRLVVPAAELARLASLRVPVKIEAVARESLVAQLGSASSTAPPTASASTVRLTLEVRSSAVVDLQP
jgi:hypothetical protein